MDNCDTAEVLRKLKISFIANIQKGVPPVRENVTFEDVVGRPSACGLTFKLYKHQFECFNALSQGKNVVLTAFTGSGKTEAWLLYALAKKKRVLALYPTKALANDQSHRIAKYYKCYNFDVHERGEAVYGDVVRYDGDTSASKGVKDSLDRALVTITNPEMLFSLLKARESLPRYDVVVLDEVDFYESHSFSLLVSLVKTLFPFAQLVVISGTLSNPQDLANFLGNAVVVSGKGFSVERRTYIVVGKEEKLREVFAKHRGELASLGVGSFDELVERAFNLYYRSVEAGLNDLKSDLYEAFLKDKPEVEELLGELKKCPETTIVFFPTINDAEATATPLGIPLHHSRRKKSERLAVERLLREGKPTMVGTVRTLLQGINVGTAKRVIHVGIPRLVREFLQREGRVGRDLNLGYSESVIIPLGFDPRLISGAKSLLAWSSLPPEATVFNPESAYVTLYLGVVKRVLSLPLTKDEERVLEHFQLADVNKARKKFEKLKFYEVGAKNVDVVLVVKGVPSSVEKASFRDLIEYYQVGAIDVRERALVESVKRTERGHYKVIEVPPSEVKPQCVRTAIDEYSVTLYSWGIQPNFELDVELAKVLSRVETTIYFQGEGFVEVNEVPQKVRWFVESRKMVNVGGKNDYAYKVISLNCGVFPRRNGYKYHTYAYLHEFSDVNYLEEGFAFFLTALRLMYGIKVDLLNYSIVGNLVKVWEREPIGLLSKMREGNFTVSGKKLDFPTFSNFLQTVKVDEIFKTVFFTVFPVRGGVDFSLARRRAIDVAMKLFGYAKVLFRDVKVLISPTTLVVDYVVDGNGNYIYSLTYNFSELGKTVTLTFRDRKEFVDKVFTVLLGMEINEIITNGISVKSQMNKYMAQFITEIDVPASIKNNYGYDVSPSDFSPRSKEILNALLTPGVSVGDKEIKEMFRERAMVLQGLRNFL
ncbi:MAG: DEAD/DEAH box helicase [Candidatus Aramenus sp.]|nr:DEAD/DEAH box helicase [Candidatus Aramenus sp.]